MPDTYIISVRREARRSTTLDLPEFLKGVPGVEIQGAANPTRVQVEASPEAIDYVRGQIGEICHIEPAILHRRL